MAQRRPRGRIATGQVLALPLTDGSFGVAHVANGDDSHNAVFVLHSIREHEPSNLLARFGPESAIAVRKGGDLPVTSGEWQILGERQVAYGFQIPTVAGWSGYTIMSNQLSAYHGLIPWDSSVFHRECLLPGVPNPPPAARFKKDFVELSPGRYALQQPSATTAKSPGADRLEHEGPAMLAVNVLLDEGQQSETMAIIVSAIEAAGIGDVETVETGKLDGNLFVVVRAGRAAKDAIEKLLEENDCIGSVEVGVLESDERCNGDE